MSMPSNSDCDAQLASSIVMMLAARSKSSASRVLNRSVTPVLSWKTSNSEPRLKPRLASPPPDAAVHTQSLATPSQTQMRAPDVASPSYQK